jgi:hypothetical protein
MSDKTACSRAQQSVVAHEVSRHSADRRTLQTASLDWRGVEGEHNGNG